MDYETAVYVYNLIKYLILDVRFQFVFGFVSLAHWAWRLPRPKKGAGNRAVFITGCDSSIGYRMARRFDEMGMHVFAGCFDSDSQIAQSLRKSFSSRLQVVQVDITKEDDVKRAVAYVKANIPDGEKGLYGLINNTEVLSYSDFELMTMDMCEEIIDVNLLGTIRVTKHFLPLICQAQGRILTITNLLARLTSPRTSIYAATKYALNGFFSVLRSELANKKVHVATIESSDMTETSNNVQLMQSHLNDIWKNFSPEELKEKTFLFEKTKKSIQESVLSPQKQDENDEYLLDDVEDALMAEEPYWRYVSAPFKKKILYWLATNLPEDISYKLLFSKLKA